MKKLLTAILMFQLMAGLLFLGLWESRGQILAAAGSVRDAGGDARSEKKDPEDVKKIAITFDDGPHPSYTEQLLDGLKERGVHATFFVTGEHAKLHPDIIERMAGDA